MILISLICMGAFNYGYIMGYGVGLALLFIIGLLSL